MMIPTARGDRSAILWLRGRLIGHRLPELNCQGAGVSVRVGSSRRRTTGASDVRAVQCRPRSGTPLTGRRKPGAPLPKASALIEIARPLSCARGLRRNASIEIDLNCIAACGLGRRTQAHPRSRLVKARCHGVAPGALIRSIRLGPSQKNLVEDVPDLEENRRTDPPTKATGHSGVGEVAAGIRAERPGLERHPPSV